MLIPIWHSIKKPLKFKVKKQSKVIISEKTSSQRLDQVLSCHPQIQTRSQAEKLIQRGYIKINNINKIKPSLKCKAGTVVYISIPNTKSDILEPANIPLDILFEDDDLIVLNKPSGLVVHPSAGHSKDTLVNALIHHTPYLSSGSSKNRPGIVHRLDKDTSGLLLVAKNNKTHEKLVFNFKKRIISREYWGITYGIPKKEFDTIDTYIARHPKNRKLYTNTKEGGKRAISHYKVLQNSEHGLSWLHLSIETGRTHQIRIHLNGINHPIIGDNQYGSSKRKKNINIKPLRDYIAQFNRIALHAKKIKFIHPTTQKEMTYEIGWPDDMKKLLSLGGFKESYE